MAQALLQDGQDRYETGQAERNQQLALDSGWAARARHSSGQESGRPAHKAALCAGCRAREARYGFRDEDDPSAERPRTLCFDCFRMEIGRRQAVAARLARSWNAQQTNLPLEETLERLTRQRRRAQIAARHALGA